MNIYEKLSDWLVPCLLGAAILQLQKIASEIKEIGKQLAVAIERVNGHELRIHSLEQKAWDRD